MTNECNSVNYLDIVNWAWVWNQESWPHLFIVWFWANYFPILYLCFLPYKRKGLKVITCKNPSVLAILSNTKHSTELCNSLSWRSQGRPQGRSRSLENRIITRRAEESPRWARLERGKGGSGLPMLVAMTDTWLDQKLAMGTLRGKGWGHRLGTHRKGLDHQAKELKGPIKGRVMTSLRPQG